jgi:hypothetical protein
MRQFLLLAALLAAAPVQADQFIVRNQGDKPIYRLYGWPSDFMPRTRSLIVAPIQPGQEAEVEVENNWGRCDITFQADRNDKRLKTSALKRRTIPFDVARIDWCQTKKRTIDMPPPDKDGSD